MKKKKKILCVGWDLALNHSGYIELTNGKLSNFFYITSKAGAAKQSNRGFRLITPDYIKIDGKRKVDKHIYGVKRLSFIKDFITNVVIEKKPDFIGIEDYAVRAEQGSHFLGECGGVARLICWENGIPLRLHDPISVKMFATHDGTCQKDLVEEAVLNRWGYDFSDFNQPNSSNREVSEDLCDAFAVAQLVWTEYQLRNGLIAMSDLHEKEIRVFNRITNTYPINLLSREWIQKAV